MEDYPNRPGAGCPCGPGVRAAREIPHQPDDGVGQQKNEKVNPEASLQIRLRG
jgi:hypothetical protein